MSKLIEAVKGNKNETGILLISLATVAAVTIVSYRLNKMEQRLDEQADRMDGVMNIIGAQIGLSRLQNQAIRDLQGVKQEI